jgi:hypothetical protein
VAARPDRATLTGVDDRADRSPPVTPDGRYLVVRGRLWRRTNPNLPPAERERLVRALMAARRAVAAARRAGDRRALQAAGKKVHAAKVALGERGPVWWTDGAPDHGRKLAENTPYAEWFAGLPEHVLEDMPRATHRRRRDTAPH